MVHHAEVSMQSIEKQLEKYSNMQIVTIQFKGRIERTIFDSLFESFEYSHTSNKYTYCAKNKIHTTKS